MIPKHKGKLIVIEGVDGSGKQTQTELLYERLIKDGQKVMLLSYPRYDKESSAMVKLYLSGAFGDNPADVSPYIASTFYTADRYTSFKEDYEDFLNDGGIVSPIAIPRLIWSIRPVKYMILMNVSDFLTGCGTMNLTFLDCRSRITCFS